MNSTMNVLSTNTKQHVLFHWKDNYQMIYCNQQEPNNSMNPLFFTLSESEPQFVRHCRRKPITQY